MRSAPGKTCLLQNIVISAGLAAGGAAEAQPTFQGLGDLPGGPFASRVQEISADGQTVVGYSSSTSGDEPFRWTQTTGMVGLGTLPGGLVFSGRARGVSP